MSIGLWQIILIVAVVVLLFGAGRISKVMGDLGKGVKSFKKGMEDEDQPKKKKPSSLPKK